MRVKKWMAALAALMLAAASLAGCSAIAELVGTTPEPTAAPIAETPAPLDAIPSMTPMPEDDTVYAVIEGDLQIKGDEFRYYFLNIKADYEYSADDPEALWADDPTLLDDIKAEAIDYCKQNKAVQNLAAAAGITLSDEDVAAVDGEIAATIEQFGGDAYYQEALTQSYLTANLYRELLLKDALQQKWSDWLFATGGDEYRTDADFTTFIHENFIRATHILVGLDAEGETTKLALAQEALQKARDGEDFEELIAQYGEDYGVTDNPDGYYFMRGYMVDAFDAAAFALEENEISDIVTSEFGYHIIKRMPMEQDYIQENLDSMRSNYEYFVLNTKLNEAMDAITDVTFTDAYNSVTVDSFT